MNTLLFAIGVSLAATAFYFWGRSVRERGDRRTEQIRRGRPGGKAGNPAEHSSNSGY